VAISRETYPTGPQLAEALTHVSCTDPNGTDPNKVPVGPKQFLNYFSLAASDRCIDFDGASGPLDFDNATGEAVSDIAMWCLRHENGSVTFDPPLDSYYSAAQGEIVWKNGEPIDFTQPDWCDANSESM
jgi:hypothetical protein